MRADGGIVVETGLVVTTVTFLREVTTLATIGEKVILFVVGRVSMTLMQISFDDCQERRYQLSE